MADFQGALGFARPALITLNRKSVEQRGLLVVFGLRGALILGWRFGSRLLGWRFDPRLFGWLFGPRLFGWRFSPRFMRRGFDLRQSVRRRLGLSSQYSWRCHIGRRCWRSGESLYRTGMPGFWRTGALTGDYHGLQHCIRNEQQCNEHQTYYCKKGENWHRVQTPRASALLVTVKPRYRDWSSWTVVQVSDAGGIGVHRGSTALKAQGGARIGF